MIAKEKLTVRKKVIGKLGVARKESVEQLFKSLLVVKVTHGDGTPMSKDAADQFLQECGSKKCMSASCLLHSLLVSMGLDACGIFRDHLIQLFALCQNLTKGHEVFLKNPHPTIYSWNALLTAHVQSDCHKHALEIFYKMKWEDFIPDRFTFLTVLKASCKLVDAEQAKLLHGQVIARGLQTDIVVGSAIVDTYAKCACMEDARFVFDSLVNRDIVTWNAIIGGYVQCCHYVPALELGIKMQESGLVPNEVTFCCLLKACSGLGISKDSGNVMHDLIVREGLEVVPMVANSLVDMYAKRGSLDVARKLFDMLCCRDLVSWNALIAGYIQNGNGWLPLQFFDDMRRAGAHPDKFTYSSVLQACGMIGALEHGKLIHNLILEDALEGNIVVTKMLLDMYAKCGSLSDGCKLFSNLQKSGDVVPWNSLIAGYTLRGDSAAAVVLFEKMGRQGVHANDVTYSWVLKAYANEGDFREGRIVHDEIIRQGLESSECVGSSLVDMYANCGSIDEGRKVFDGLPRKDLVLWNALISGYMHTEQSLLAHGLFEEMQLKDIRPDNFTFSCIVKSCGNINDMEGGRLIHDQLLKSQCESDIVLGNALVDMYGKFGMIEDSYAVFQMLIYRDLVSWNALITASAQHERFMFVLELHQQMQEESVNPDETTYASVLKACVNLRADLEGRLVHHEIMRSGLESAICIKSQLANVYIESLSAVLGGCLSSQTESSIPWKSIIVSHGLNGHGPLAFEYFWKMQEEGIEAEKNTYLAVLKACSNLGATLQGRFVHDHMIRNGCEIDMVTGSTLLDMYAKCGSIEEASVMFDRLPSRDVVAWNAMIGGYTRQGDYIQASHCLNKMEQHGVDPDIRTYSSVLAVCSRAGRADKGNQFFRFMSERHGVLPDDVHFTCMIDILSRVGQLDQAEVLLKTLPCLPDVHGWRSLLSACRAHGDRDLGRQCYAKAVSLHPENSSGYVLMSNIYAEAGMLKDAYEIQGPRLAGRARKILGKSWIEFHRSVYEFVTGEKICPRGDLILLK